MKRRKRLILFILWSIIILIIGLCIWQKYILITVLALLIIFNLFVLLTGKIYVYKGMKATYFSGKLQPTIYDGHVFKNRKISRGISTPWKKHAKLGTIDISASEKKFIKKFKPASFLITKGDEIIYESYWNSHDKDKLGNSFSMAKSIVALLIGVAIEDGLIKNIDEPVSNYLDEFNDQDKSEITIRHILTMSSGLSWTEKYVNPFSNVAELYYSTKVRDLCTKNRIVESSPGQIFDYKSGDTQVLMYIIQSATGKNVSDYASEKIWSKIGAESDAKWSLVGDKNSEEKSFCCVYGTSRDFARLGRLINQNGKWNGEQLIDAQFILDFKTPAPLKNKFGKDNNDYGFQYWIYTGLPYEVTYFRGILGQYIISIPEHDLVIVRTGTGVGDEWINTPTKIDNALEGHRVEMPEYISIAMDFVNRL